VTTDRSRLPPVGPDVSVRFPAVTRDVLPSGLRVWSARQRDVPVVTLALVVPNGSAADPPERPGLAALTADLLDEGSGDRDAIAMHEALARIGAQLDTDTGYDATVISLVTLSRFHREALHLLADIVFRPRLAEEDFHRVRELRCNRLVQMRDLPAALVEEAFVGELFGGHPYGHLPIGTEVSLRGSSVDAVRRFHAARYRPHGTLLIAAGDIGADVVAADARSAFGGLDSAAPVDFASVESMTGASGRRLVLVDRPGAPQSELRVGHVAVARSTPDYHALVVLNALLGGQFVSRINLNLREEKGFTYGARSGFEWRRAPGPFVVQTSVQTSATAAAVSEILRELADVAGDRPPTERELALARASLTRGYARNFETAEQIARALAQMAIYDLPASWFDEFVGRINAVDIEAVIGAARRHLRPADAIVAVVGDRARVGDELSALGFDDPARSSIAGV
jgi:predicted Zn-dependent peptidase